MGEKSFSERTQFPNHWKAEKINDLCEFVVDCIHHTPELSDSPTGYFMVRTSDVGGGHVRLENARFISKEVYEDRIQRGKPQWGDIIISREAPLGNVGQILTDENICLGQRLIHYRPNKDIVDIRYLLFAILSPMVQKQFRANEGRGSIVDNLLMQTAKDLSIPIPPLNEQQKIAAVLSALDAKIELNQRINAELESMAKTLYDYWFVQFDFPTTPSALSGTSPKSDMETLDNNKNILSDLGEAGRGYKSAGGKMVWNETLKREIPLGWENGELSDIANITMGQSPPGESYNEDGEGMIFFQGCTDFGNRFPTVRQFTTQPTRFAKEGDILLSVRAPVGTINIAKENCCIGRGLAALNSKDNCIAYLFGVMINLKQIFDRRNVNGTTFGSITKDDLYSLKVVRPDKEILRQYQKTINPAFEKLNKIELENQSLSELRDWLLPMLMNGQVKIK